MPTDRFEVIVADDGSSDRTREVAESYQDRLRLRYVFQEDLGFRAGEARNLGARAATAPVLAFVDTGVRAGPDFVSAHRDAHATPDRMVIGYTYGYNPTKANPELVTMLDEVPLEEIVARNKNKWSFWDPRHPDFALARFDLSRLKVPWLMMWSLNFSVRRDDFWAVGGFDEDFRGWGLEDIDLGYRFLESGRDLILSRDAWAIETPHPRNQEENLVNARRNAELFYRKHPVPAVEMYLGNYTRPVVKHMEEDHVRLESWQQVAQSLDVTDEVLGAVADADLDGAARVLVIGSGAGSETWPADWHLIDFDQELVAEAMSTGRNTVAHGLGMSTPFEEGHFDIAILTSRTLGIWDDWGANILAEARRVAAEVWLKPSGSDRLTRDESVVSELAVADRVS